jgi:hypothetical protein
MTNILRGRPASPPPCILCITHQGLLDREMFQIKVKCTWYVQYTLTTRLSFSDNYKGDNAIIQNYWVFGLCPSSGILETRKRFKNWISFRSQVRGEKTRTLVGPLGGANLNHYQNCYAVQSCVTW